MLTFALLKKHLFLFGTLRDNSRGKYFHIIPNCVVYSFLWFYFISTFWFFTFTANTFQERADSFYYMSSSVLLFSWYSIYLLQRVKYIDLFDKLDAIIERRSKVPLLEKIYQNTNDKIESATQTLNQIFIQKLLPFLSCVSAILSMVVYLLSECSENCFLLFYPATFPFTCNTPSKYLACILAEASSIFTAGELFAITLILTTGFCLYMCSFISDIQQCLHDLNEDIVISKTETLTHKQNVRLTNKLLEVIRFCIEARRFTECFSNTHGGIIFAYVLFALVSYGCIFLQIRMLLETNNFIRLLQVLVPYVIAIFWLYFFCHFGSEVTQRFQDIEYSLYQLDWYHFPLNMQKVLRMLLDLSQKKIYIRGFGGTRCTRKVFKKILNITYYSYLLLRSFENNFSL